MGLVVAGWEVAKGGAAGAPPRRKALGTRVSLRWGWGGAREYPKLTWLCVTQPFLGTSVAVAVDLEDGLRDALS